MSEKQTVKFGDICREVKLTTKDPIADGYERYIGLEHLDSGSLKIKRWGMIAEDNPSFTRVFQKGHILFGKRRPYLKKAAIAEFDGICSGDIIVIEPSGDFVPSELFPFLVQSDCLWDYAIKTSSGSLSPRTKFSSISEYRFCANKEESVYTSSLNILRKIEDSIDKTEAFMRSSESLFNTLVNEARNGKWGRKYNQNNESWLPQKLRNMVTFRNGKAHEKFIEQDGKYIVVNSKFISSDGEEYIASNSPFCPVVQGDILMVMSDVPNGKAIAKCFLVDKDDTYTVNQRVAVFSPTCCDSRFLLFMLNRNPYYLRFDDGLKQTNLRKDEVLDCPILVPELSIQKEIASTLEKICVSTNTASKNLKSLIELKRSITRDIFTKVSDI